MEGAYPTYAAFVGVVRYVVFGVAVVAALIALLDWAVRTRRVQPFSAVARFCRRVIDPLMRPVEERIVRSGGQPSNAPWWTLVVVIVGGLILITLLEFLANTFSHVAFGISSPGRFGKMLVSAAFFVLRLALIVRVLSTWFQVSPYSRWIRWSYVLTEWMLAPVRRLLPPFGAIDASPLVVFLLLWVLQSALGL